MDKHCVAPSYNTASVISNKIQRITDKQHAWVSKTSHQCRRSLTQIYTLWFHLFAEWEQATLFWWHQNSVACGEQGVIRREHEGPSKMTAMFYILMEAVVTGESALIKTQSCALKFYAFTCRFIWPQWNNTSLWDLRANILKRMECIFFLLIFEWRSHWWSTSWRNSKKTQTMAERTIIFLVEPELEEWSKHSTEGLAFTCWSVLAINI